MRYPWGRGQLLYGWGTERKLHRLGGSIAGVATLGGVSIVAVGGC